jgi:Putative lumazine-binding
MRYLILLTAAAALAGSAVTRGDDDEKLIRQHIERYYFEGVRNSDTSAAHKAFHPVAVMYSVRDGELAQRTIPDWLGAIAERAPNPPKPDAVKRRVVMVNVSGNAAVARLELASPETTITDFMSLLKVNGQWTVVGKIFDRQAAAPQAAGR